ncbi:hypothetical protein BDQ17DRAFT_1527545 [Cyathus striatus]|nr:hypothetical protein BDQ17DRAFT_1527545 [Cyathus striatus]
MNKLYAADLFLTPPDLSRPSSTTGIAKLRSLQRQAALLITGGLRSTPNDALDTLAGLLPFHLLLAQCQHRALLRYCTLPATNPIYNIVSHARNRKKL